MKVIAIILGFIACFFAGSYWQKYKLLESRPVQLTEPLALQTNPEAIGELPKGTILYPYSSNGSIDTFIVFVNTKSLDLLIPHKFEQQFTIAPIDGYVE
ncbi:hypothetical protein [Salinibius halmophilus]|uniref:hypothetical protein n=1 Tax=Salinibius halmophilus TaxID=1853216 RepID=UPI000E670E7F|nr:hypothetical protein [Salinibius halmophilus]